MVILKDYFSERLFKDPKFQIFHDVTAEDRVSIIECGIYAFSKGKEFTIVPLPSIVFFAIGISAKIL